MKITLLQENLSKTLNTVSRFTSPKAQLPVLGNILLRTAKNKILLSATNLEMSISTSVGAKVEKEGEITVPARTFTEVISNLSVGALTLEAEKEQIKVKSANFSSVISAMNSADFPLVPSSLGKSPSKMSSGVFLSALSKVLFSVSSDETRPVLTGVLFKLAKNNLILVATDGFRLSLVKTKTSFESEDAIILPKGILSEVLRIAESEDEILFSYDKTTSQAIFGVGDSVLSSRIIEGSFPDYEKIIPKNKSVTVNADKSELLQAVRLSSVFARDASDVVKFLVEESSLLLTAESSKSGSQETKVDVKTQNENPSLKLLIGYNYKFVEDFLNVCESEEVEMEFTDSNSPGVFKDTKSSEFVHLIMPIKLGD